MRILFSGGGTLGSVTPLLAAAEEFKKRGPHEFLWLGTSTGPERFLVEEWGICFRAIRSGKWRRYFSWRNLFDPFQIFFGCAQALWRIIRFHPDAVMTAGSFAAVPVAFAAALLRVPLFVHQQDLRWGIANRLMRPFARRITVNFDENFAALPPALRERAQIIGNPVREAIRNLASSPEDRPLKFSKFNLDSARPVLVALGGGTGAAALNDIVAQAVPALAEVCQILHLTGKEKRVKVPSGDWERSYHWQAFLTKEMADVFAVADLVITRAGLGTLTELAAIGKPIIIVPMPDTHQEENARYFADKGAAVLLDQKTLTPELLARVVREILASSEARKRLSEKIRALANPKAAEEMADVVISSLKR